MRYSWLLIVLLGCGKDICIRNSDCVLGEVCGIEGACVAIVDDAGVDADPVDAMTTPDADASVDVIPDAMPDATTDGGP